jgi:diguanylate cyclase (GGDEF)-like protein
MNLRKQTILAISVTFFLTMAIGYFYTHTLFLQGYLSLENQEIKANASRFNKSLNREIENLGALTNDWAAWDDTYNFMENQNQEYINSNLVEDTYSELGLNFIIYLDNNGTMIFKKAFDLENGVEIPLQNSIYLYMKNLVSALPITLEDENHQGVFSENGLPVLFAARPILNSLDEGPSHGTLIFGKYLSGTLFDNLSSSVDSEIFILPYSLEQYNLYPQSSADPEIHINISRPDKVYFYSLIKDSSNVPIYIIEQILPRTIYQQGLKSSRDFLNSLIISSLIVALIILIALEFGFLRRFSKLTQGIKNFKAEKPNSIVMILKGRDELSILSNEIHNALMQLSKTQRDLTTHLDFEKLLVSISTKFINLPLDKIDDGINRLLKVIGDFSKVDRSYILLLREDDPFTLDNTNEWCADGITSMKIIRQNIKLPASSWWMKELQKEKPILINDVSLIPEEAKTFKEFFIYHSIRSLAAVPLMIGGELIGLLGYDSILENKNWSEQVTLLLEVFATVVANAIDRNRHENKILQNQLNLINLNALTINSIGKTTMEALCLATSNKLSTLTNCDNSYLVISAGNNKFHLYHAGQKENLDTKKTSILNELFEKPGSKYILKINNKRKQENQIQMSGDFLGRSFIALSLNSKATKLGMILFSYDTPHKFSRDEVFFCQQSAAQITLSIIKTIALESAHQKTNELNALRETIADITSELELSKLLNTLLERAIRLMKADGGDFCMVDEESNNLKVVASVNLDKDYIDTRIRSGEGASGKALASKKPVLVEDYSSWTEKLDSLKDSGLKSALVLPLIIGNRVLGTLGIFHLNPEKRISADDQHLLSLFAQHASIAIENALLFKKVQEIARIDEVTGLLNRRAFNEIGEYEIKRSKRLGHPISLAMIDIDDFKRINDTFGHIMGDQVLKEISQFLMQNIRNIDIISRYGGDEATILMPETNLQNATLAMNRLRELLEAKTFNIENNNFKITASFGVSSFLQKPPDMDEIIKQADSAMYSAKRDGKNCVKIYFDM